MKSLCLLLCCFSILGSLSAQVTPPGADTDAECGADCWDLFSWSQVQDGSGNNIPDFSEGLASDANCNTTIAGSAEYTGADSNGPDLTGTAMGANNQGISTDMWVIGFGTPLTSPVIEFSGLRTNTEVLITDCDGNEITATCIASCGGSLSFTSGVGWTGDAAYSLQLSGTYDCINIAVKVNTSNDAYTFRIGTCLGADPFPPCTACGTNEDFEYINLTNKSGSGTGATADVELDGTVYGSAEVLFSDLDINEDLSGTTFGGFDNDGGTLLLKLNFSNPLSIQQLNIQNLEVESQVSVGTTISGSGASAILGGQILTVCSNLSGRMGVGPTPNEVITDGPGCSANPNGSYTVSTNPVSTLYFKYHNPPGACSFDYFGFQLGSCVSDCSVTASATPTHETCGGNSDGTITVTATGTGCSGTLEYSLDGGAFQASNVFSNVAPGAHTVTIRCSTDPSCTTTATATVNPGASVSATATATNETCTGGNDGTITVTASAMNCAGTLEYSLDGGTFQASNVLMGVSPGMHTVTVRCSTSPTCTATANATVNPGAGTCPTVSQTNPNDPTSFDPCSCGDPLNFYDADGDVTFFHDFVEVTSVTGETWEVAAVSAMAYSDAGATNIMIGDGLTETPPGSGIYRIDLFHPPGVGFTMTVDRTAGGGPFPLMEGGTCLACKQVPTLGQWGLILLSLLILTFGVVALRKREPVLAGYGSTVSNNKFTLPFDKTSFGKMLIAVMIGLAAVFAVAVSAFGYEMTAADVPGSLVAGPMLAYLIHLLIPRKD